MKRKENGKMNKLPLKECWDDTWQSFFYGTVGQWSTTVGLTGMTSVSEVFFILKP